MSRKPDFSQRPSCPYCDHPTKVYINSHYHRRAPDGSLIHVTSFICSECKRTFSFPKPTNRYNKLFHFPYPRCPHCNRTMQIYKIRRSYVRFRCALVSSNLTFLSLYLTSLCFSPLFVLFLTILFIFVFLLSYSFTLICLSDKSEMF